MLFNIMALVMLLMSTRIRSSLKLVVFNMSLSDLLTSTVATIWGPHFPCWPAVYILTSAILVAFFHDYHACLSQLRRSVFSNALPSVARFRQDSRYGGIMLAGWAPHHSGVYRLQHSRQLHLLHFCSYAQGWDYHRERCLFDFLLSHHSHEPARP